MGNKSIFARGYSASRAEKERQDKARENMGKKLWRFFLMNDGDEADLRFLTEEPVNFYEHNVKRGDRYEQFTCTGDDCPLCADGDKHTYKSAYLVVDRREFSYKDKNGKQQTGKNQVRLFVQGMRVTGQLDRISEKYGLSNRDVTIIRIGKGTQTTYTVERGEEEKITAKEIKQYLPEKLRDEYDGTVNSLMNIVEEQLMMCTPDYNGDDTDDADEEETSDNSDKIVGLEEDDEEEEQPKKKLGKKGNMFKKAQDSRKPRAKSLMKKQEEEFDADEEVLF